MAEKVRPLKLLCAIYDEADLILHAEGEDAECFLDYSRWLDDHGFESCCFKVNAMYVWEGTCTIDESVPSSYWMDRVLSVDGAWRPANLEDLGPLVGFADTIPTPPKMQPRDEAFQTMMDVLEKGQQRVVDEKGRYNDWERW
jgi:hypothetical protein